MKYLLISLLITVGVESVKTGLDVNNVTDPSVTVTEINSPEPTPTPTASPPTTPSTPTPITTTKAPNITTTADPNVTTSAAPNVTTTVAPNVTTTAAPNITTTTISTTVQPTTIKPPISTIAPEHHRSFDGPSFVGGIVLALGLVAIGFVAFKFYKARTELNYHTL